MHGLLRREYNNDPIDRQFDASLLILQLRPSCDWNAYTLLCLASTGHKRGRASPTAGSRQGQEPEIEADRETAQPLQPDLVLRESFPFGRSVQVSKAMFGREIRSAKALGGFPSCDFVAPHSETSCIMKHLLKITGLMAVFAYSFAQVPAYAQSVINRSLSGMETGGVLEPVKNTEVATAEMGVLREVFVKQGDIVEVGSPIGRLDHEQQMVQVREAELELASTGTLETARNEFEFSQRRRDKTAKMVTEKKATLKELERDQLDLNISAAKLKAQEESKLLAKAKLDRAQLVLNERTIRAPHAGTVVEVYRDVGEYVAGNAPAIIRLMDASKLRARFFLSDEVAEKFRKMDHAEVRLANHVVARASIEFIAPFAIAEGHVIEMTVLIDNESGSIRSSKCELVLP
ncbi:MAG: efflux RND transporter periplasmic adaptor subunit [Pirellula sp.]